MIGTVDAENRALLEIVVCSRLAGNYIPVTAWIDTAFDGHLVFPLELIRELALDALVKTEAILADGSKILLDTYLGCSHKMMLRGECGAAILVEVSPELFPAACGESQRTYRQYGESAVVLPTRTRFA